jgi:selenide,water dikinase
MLVLTKPLGTGVIATALKAGQAPDAVVAEATRVMATLNRAAADAALNHGARAATDITGFGLAGHAAAVARESRLTLELRIADLPLLPGALELAQHFQPGGLKANRRHFEPQVAYQSDAEEARKVLLFDPQTSGGLLLLVPAIEVDALLEALPQARVIGRALSPGERPLQIV